MGHCGDGDQVWQRLGNWTRSPAHAKTSRGPFEPVMTCWPGSPPEVSHRQGCPVVSPPCAGTTFGWSCRLQPNGHFTAGEVMLHGRGVRGWWARLRQRRAVRAVAEWACRDAQFEADLLGSLPPGLLDRGDSGRAVSVLFVATAHARGREIQPSVGRTFGLPMRDAKDNPRVRHHRPQRTSPP
jgi:hypothetical protein